MAKSIDIVRGLTLWKSAVEPRPLSGGLSNESFTVEDGGHKYVVRLGEDIAVHHVFRDNELMASKAAAAAGFAPDVVFSGDGVMVIRFVEGKTFDDADVRGNIERIASLAKNFHKQMPRYISGPGRFFWPFHVVRDYARTLKAGNSRMMDKVPGYVELAGELEAIQVPMPIVYAHNDLLPANFIDDGEKIWLIDFEYAAFSTPMFDLAGISSNALFSAEDDVRLLEAYFGHPPNEATLKAHRAMKCASLLREAMWSMVSELHLNAPGVDYEAYTNENLERLEAVVAAYRQLG